MFYLSIIKWEGFKLWNPLKQKCVNACGHEGSKGDCVCVCLNVRCDLTFHKFHIALDRKKLGKLLRLHTKEMSFTVLFCSLSLHS